tara:strand:+ start:28 stop:1185 length:1158 start_codon:yes stop_codon:yes gene_type:complete
MALTKRYVRADASGTGNGTTDANSGANGAFTWAQFITDINTPRAGYKYIVMSIGGAFANGTTTTTLTGDGTTTSPNVIEGCYQTEGDLLANGRDSVGALVTTNFPVISYTGTTARLAFNTADYLVFRCLSVTSAASNPTMQMSIGSVIDQCLVTNTGTNALSQAITSTAINATVSNSDLSTASTGSDSAVKNSGADMLVIGCRIKCVPGVGITTTTRATIVACTIFESTIGVAIAASQTLVVINTTIANCTGDGIDVAAAVILPIRIINCHITGNGGYGVDWNAATCAKTTINNRFRDNTSGDQSVTDDWIEGTSVRNVTSNDTDGDDFTNQGADDYSLLVTAPAIVAGIGYRNPIGAHGAGSFGSGGGSALHLGGPGQTGIGSF